MTENITSDLVICTLQKALASQPQIKGELAFFLSQERLSCRSEERTEYVTVQHG